MSHGLSKQQAQRNQELNEERKQRNLAIATRVAAGELCPVVVSFSPAMRAQLRLAKRYKHTRIFVETHEVTSLAALHTALRREIPHPLAEIPREAFELAVRPPADNGVEDEKAEDSWQPGAPLALDKQLQDAYHAAQDARSSGVGKLRLCVCETGAFQAFLDSRRGYALALNGSLPGGLSPEDATHWIMTSFYTLRLVSEQEELCKRLIAAWQPLGVLGRVYVAQEGVNAQVSVPDNMMELFTATVANVPELAGVYLNKDDPLPVTSAPFVKLQVKPRKQVLADGLGSGAYDWSNNGKKLPPALWHDKLQLVQQKAPNAPLLFDVRNFYESEVGWFDGAEPLDTATFRDTWEALKDKLKGVPKDREILTYCTGGIRCEKANAYIIQELGFDNVAAVQGGIVNYAQWAAAKGVESKFKGVNHVFDQRLGQRVGTEVLSRCINCGTPSDVQTDCLNTHCPRPFARRRYVQCAECAVEQGGSCSGACGEEMRCRTELRGRMTQLEQMQSSLRAARRRQLQRLRTRDDLALKAAVLSPEMQRGGGGGRTCGVHAAGGGGGEVGRGGEGGGGGGGAAGA
jgi:UPF0176 protein